MPGGPLAHICLLVRDLDRAIADWTAILGELDPGQLVEPLVVDRWEAGEDVMSSATFVNPGGCEIQLLCPLNDGPLGRRLGRRGEGVHHVCFTAPDLPAVVSRLAAKGVKLTSTELSRDPARDWQAWTFISARVEPRAADRACLPLPCRRGPVGRRGRARPDLDCDALLLPAPSVAEQRRHVGRELPPVRRPSPLTPACAGATGAVRSRCASWAGW